MLKESLLDIWPNQMMINGHYDDLLSLLLTISTTLLSIDVSVFTLSTAFLVSKKDTQKEVYDKILKDGNSLTLSKRYNALKRFIVTIKGVSKYSIYSMGGAVLTIVLTIVFQNLSPNPYIYLIYLPVIVSFIFTCICLFVLMKWFFKSIKN